MLGEEMLVTSAEPWYRHKVMLNLLISQTPGYMQEHILTFILSAHREGFVVEFFAPVRML